MGDQVGIRTADLAELPGVRNVLDGAGLALRHSTLRDAVRSDAVLVAVADTDAAGIILGGVVCRDGAVVAIGVRRRRRGQGIGTALVEAAARRHGRLRVECDPDVGPFWESLGVSLSPTGEDDRLEGLLRPAGRSRTRPVPDLPRATPQR